MPFQRKFHFPGTTGTGGALEGAVKNPEAVMPIASTPDPADFLVVPRPIAIEPFLEVPPIPPPLFSILIIDLALVVDCWYTPFPFAPVVCIERVIELSFEGTLRCRGRYVPEFGPVQAVGGDELLLLLLVFGPL